MQILINSSSKIPKLLLMEEIRLTTWDEKNLKNLVNNGMIDEPQPSTVASFILSCYLGAMFPPVGSNAKIPTFILFFGKSSERKNGGISHFTIRKNKGNTKSEGFNFGTKSLYRLMMFEITFSNFSTNLFWLFICLLSHFRRSKMPVPQPQW